MTLRVYVDESAIFSQPSPIEDPRQPLTDHDMRWEASEAFCLVEPACTGYVRHESLGVVAYCTDVILANASVQQSSPAIPFTRNHDWNVFQKDSCLTKKCTSDDKFMPDGHGSIKLFVNMTALNGQSHNHPHLNSSAFIACEMHDGGKKVTCSLLGSDALNLLPNTTVTIYAHHYSARSISTHAMAHDRAIVCIVEMGDDDDGLGMRRDHCSIVYVTTDSLFILFIKCISSLDLTKFLTIMVI